MMETDAEERHRRRKQAEEEAAEIKELGNKEFQQGNYQKAVEYYSAVSSRPRVCCSDA